MAMRDTIHDVRLIPKRKIKDDRGAVYHMLKSTDPEFAGFGEIYFSQVLPGVIKAWHTHMRMIRNYLVVSGAILLVLFDDRDDSPTKGVYQEIRLDDRGDGNTLVVIPTGVWSGFKGMGDAPSIVANCASIPHDPTEVDRKALDDPFFSYRWPSGQNS